MDPKNRFSDRTTGRRDFQPSPSIPDHKPTSVIPFLHANYYTFRTKNENLC